MKTIKVTDEMYDSLMELSREINTQDHRSTAMPYFFQVQTNEVIYVPEGCGYEVWVMDGSTIETEEEVNEEIKRYKEWDDKEFEKKKLDDWEKDKTLEEAGWRQVNRSYEFKYQNAFLTEKACKQHIAANKHHYQEPVDYLSYAFRNPDLKLIFQFLCKLTGKDVHK